MAQQTGSVSGHVTNATTQAPIQDVIIMDSASGRRVRTDSSGAYLMGNLQPGTHRLRANLIGYSSLGQSVTVTDGATATADFALTKTAATLQEVVVQGTAIAAVVSKQVGASVGVITMDSLAHMPIENFSQLLDARVAGLAVDENSGVIGSGSRITLRGVGSTALNTQPLIVIDGVRAYNDVQGLEAVGGLGGQGVSRFDDLDFQSIENVEVLHGPAASALYGTEAAAGVLVITTKHGIPAKHAQWNSYGQLGRVQDVTNYPAQWGRPATGGGLCPLILEYASACTGASGVGAATAAFDSNIVKSGVPFANGSDNAIGLSVEGGNELTTYYVGGDWDRQQGVFQNNGDRWTHVSGAFGLHPMDKLDLNFTAQYTQRRAELPLGDNALGGPFASALLAEPFVSNPGYLTGNTPGQLETIPTTEGVDRLTVGGSGTLRLLSWLTVRGTVGMDFSSIDDIEIIQAALGPALTTAGLGEAQAANTEVFDYTGSMSAEAKYSLTKSLTGTTTLGGEWVDESLREVFGSGLGLAPGGGSVATTSQNFSASEANSDVVNIGGYLQETLAWREVLFGNIAGRLDGNSAFGRNQSTAFYPSGSLSYVVSDESFWPKNDAISSLRFRFAGGQSGTEPTFRLASASYQSESYLPTGTGLIINTSGNALLKPERTTEFEAGFDLGLMSDRFSFNFTAYDRADRNLIQNIPVDVSVGNFDGAAGTAAVTGNLGQIDNRGFEMSLGGNVFTAHEVALDLELTATVNHNKLISLGNLPPADVAQGITGAITQYDLGGQPIGVYKAVPYTYADLNHDGVIEPNEITYGDSAVVMGEPGPRDMFTIAPVLHLFRYIAVAATLDRHDGVTVYDGTDAFRCIGPNFLFGQECNDPHALLKNQAAAVALNSGFYGGPETEYGYILNGSFWKLREVAVTLIAPSYVARHVGAYHASLTISGRNLATWTPYRGLDPEVSYSTFSNVASPLPYINSQFMTQPPLRTLILRLNLTY